MDGESEGGLVHKCKHVVCVVSPRQRTPDFWGRSKGCWACELLLASPKSIPRLCTDPSGEGDFGRSSEKGGGRSRYRCFVIFAR